MSIESVNTIVSMVSMVSIVTIKSINMKLIEPKVELLSELDTTPESHIARCARVCYGKEFKEPNQEADKKIVDGLIKRGHCSMLRHSSVYIGDLKKYPFCYNWLIDCSPYWSNNTLYEYASTNLQEFEHFKKILMNGRAYYKDDDEVIISIIDNNSFLKECTETPELFKLYRFTFCITTQISTSRELNRKSPNNIAERSTRYCSSKDDLEICKPWWFNAVSENMSALNITKLPVKEKVFAMSWKDAENSYNKAIELGMMPEDARGILPLDTATKVIYTYSVQEWQHILDLRLYDKTGKAHPNCHVVMAMVRDQINEFAKEHYIDYQV